MSRAYREYVDVLTGQRFAGPKAGTVASGRYVTRKRVNGRTVLVPVDREYVNPKGASFPVDPDAGPELDRAAKRLLERQATRRPKGVRVSFKSPKQAAETLYSNNPFYAEAAEADSTDAITEWMDFTVKHGRGRTKFARTRTGKAIANALRTRPTHAIKLALQWIIGQSRGRRWSDVDWRSVDEFNSALREAWERGRDSSAYLAKGWTSGGGLSWYPATSGRKSASGTATEAERQVVRTSQEAGQLAEIEDELVLAVKAGKKCLTAPDRKVVNRRIRRIRWLMEHPKLIADSGFCGEKDEAVCTYGSLLEDARKLRGACEEPYDPDWPLQAALEAIAADDDRRLYDFPGAVRREAEERAPRRRAKPTVKDARKQFRTLRSCIRRDR